MIPNDVPAVVPDPGGVDDGGNFAAYTALLAEYAKFGNMLYPATYADRNRAGTTLDQAANFPLMGGVAGVNLFIYIPIRRYARGSIHAQSYSLMHELVTPNRIAPIFERQEAALAWGVRDLHWGDDVAVRTFPSIPMGGSLDQLVDISNPIGIFFTYFEVAAGQGGNPDTVRPNRYYFDGSVATTLEQINGSADHNDTLYFLILQYTLRVQKTAAQFTAATIEGQVTEELRYEVVWFKKSDIHQAVHGPKTYWYIGQHAYKTNLTPSELTASVARTALYTSTNLQAGPAGNLAEANFVQSPQRLGEKQFNRTLMPFATHAVPDAEPTDKRITRLAMFSKVPFWYYRTRLVIPTTNGHQQTMNPTFQTHYSL